jgi:hypothetical protein
MNSVRAPLALVEQGGPESWTIQTILCPEASSMAWAEANRNMNQFAPR